MCIITFLSTQHLLQAEDILNENNLRIKIIPVNHNIITNCNKAIEFDCSLMSTIGEIFERNKIMIERFHNVSNIRLTLTERLLKEEVA